MLQKRCIDIYDYIIRLGQPQLINSYFQFKSILIKYTFDKKSHQLVDSVVFRDPFVVREQPRLGPDM